MLDHIIVETGGVKMPLSRLAIISVIDSKTLSVTPYDPDVTNLALICLYMYTQKLCVPAVEHILGAFGLQTYSNIV